MRNFILIALTLICFSCERKAAPNSAINFYPKQLGFGGYSVGFRTLWSYDITRTALPYSDWDGRLYPTDESKGRQFQINLWYPTETKNKLSMNMKSYLDLSYRQINFDETPNSIGFGQKEFVKKLNALRGEDSLTITVLNKLESLPVKAVQNAVAVNKKFPVILYPNGMAPVANSTTAEYLASYGYVVVGFATKGENSATADNSTKGAIVASEDIGFVLSEVLELPFVDRNNIGIMGNAIASSFSIAYLCQNRNIDAYVSLEGGFISNFEQGILSDLPFYEPSNIDIPLLMIYSPHPSIDPATITHLEYAKRYFAHLPGMHEFEYLTFGLFNSVVPNIIGQPRGDIAEGYSAAHQLIRRYFDMQLKGHIANFDSDFLQTRGNAIDTTFIWQAIPNLPVLAHIKNGYMQNGLQYIDSLYNHQKHYTQIPFSPKFINDFTDWVAWKKDPDYNTRRWLMQKAVQDYPSSSLYSYYLGRYALNYGDSLQAKEQFQLAITKLKTNPDQELTQEEKSIIKKRAEAMLGEL